MLDTVVCDLRYRKNVSTAHEWVHWRHLARGLAGNCEPRSTVLRTNSLQYTEQCEYGSCTGALAAPGQGTRRQLRASVDRTPHLHI
jgi:hypothetical protein